MGFWQNLFRASGARNNIATGDAKTLLAEMLRGTASGSGITVTPDRAMQCATAYSCGRVLAEGVAQLPIKLYERLERGKQPANAHPLYALLHDAPNEFQTAFEWWESCMWQLVFRGNAYGLKNIIRGQLQELLPLHPDRVKPHLSNGYAVNYTIRNDNGEERTVPAAQVFHIRGLTLDSVTGLSIINYAREAIGLALATEQHGGSLFANGARPSGILSSDGVITAEQAKVYRESWQQAHGAGRANENGTAVLGGALKWTPVSITNEDAQFLETRKYQRSEIAGLFRVPGHMINDDSRAQGWSTLEAKNRDFLTYTLMPWMRRIEQAISRDLILPHDRQRYFAEFAIEGFLRADSAGRATFYRTMREIGALSANEIREMENRNPRTDELGDAYLEPANTRSSAEGNTNEAEQGNL